MTNRNRVILGIHSNLDGSGSSGQINNTGNIVDQFAAGHAWISVTTNGINVRYGLWPVHHGRGTNEKSKALYISNIPKFYTYFVRREYGKHANQGGVFC